MYLHVVGRPQRSKPLRPATGRGLNSSSSGSRPRIASRDPSAIAVRFVVVIVSRLRVDRSPSRPARPDDQQRRIAAGGHAHRNRAQHRRLEGAIADGRISEGHGRALAAITIPELQRAVLRIVLERHLSVRQTEELVRRRRTAAPAARVGALSHDLQDLEAQLRGILATRVGIVRSRRGGRLVIDFASDEELDRIYSIITRGVSGGSYARAATPSPIKDGSQPA